MSKKYKNVDIIKICILIKKYLLNLILYMYKKIKSRKIETLLSTKKTNKKEYSINKKEVKQVKEKENKITLNKVNITNLSNNIKKVNEKNFPHIKQFFNSYTFSDKIIEKYDNHFVKLINCNKKNANKCTSLKINKNIISFNSRKKFDKKDKTNLNSKISHIDED